MAPHSHNAISSNSATDHSRQYNQIFNVFVSGPLISPWPENIALEMFARDHPKVNELGPLMYEFLRGQIADQLYSKPPATVISSKAAYCFLKDPGFSQTCYFDTDLDRCSARYPIHNSVKQVMKILSGTHIGILAGWVRAPASAVLLVDRYTSGREELAWTTDFTLEVIGRITHSHVNTGLNQRSSAVVTYFCSERLRGPGHWRQDEAVQDFLIQLCRARHNLLEAYHDCGARGTNHDIFHRKPTTTSDWWRLLRQCVSAAGIRVLYVLLDNVDAIHDRPSNPQEFDDFVAKLKSFLVACEENSVPVKLLVTSRSARTRALFSNLRLGVAHIKLDYPGRRRLP